MNRIAAAAKVALAKTIKQVAHHSGRMYHFNLDESSFTKLEEISQYFTNAETPSSFSVIIRRAIRNYYIQLKNIKTEAEAHEEGYQLLKAAKGT